MLKQSTSPLVIFVHVPRAGGTSAWRALRKVYRNRLCRVTGLGTERTYEKLREILLTASHDYDLVGGQRLPKTGQAAPNRLPPLPDRPIVETVRRLRGNPMTRLLCGVDDGWGRPQGRCTRDHLEHAKHNLREHFSAIAFVESYQESMQAMADALGWKTVPTVEKRNSGRSRPAKYPDEVYEAGREVSALDYELYDFARSLERERLQRSELARSAPTTG
jgi:hypothetical protein